MIRPNASLLSLTTPRISDGSGGFSAGVTTAVTGVRCMVDEPSRAQSIAAAGQVAELSDVLYVLITALPEGLAPMEGGTLVYQLDGLPSATRKIARVHPRVKEGGLSHYEVWLVQQ